MREYKVRHFESEASRFYNYAVTELDPNGLRSPISFDVPLNGGMP